MLVEKHFDDNSSSYSDLLLSNNIRWIENQLFAG